MKHTTEEREQLRIQERDLETKQSKKRRLEQNTAKKLVKKAKMMTKKRQKPEIPVAKAKVHDWVAVAFENGWYPGIVTQIGPEKLTVDFLHPTSVQGRFKDPPRPDVAEIYPTFVFACPIDQPSLKQGRHYTISNCSRLQEQYNALKARIGWTA